MENTKGAPDLRLFSKVDKIVFGLLGLIVIAVVAWKVFAPSAKEKTSTKVAKKEKVAKDTTANNKSKKKIVSSVKILEKWDMPPELKEISALSYMDDERFVCVEDESGTIFRYNIKSNTVEKRIQFAAKGDYEGIALKNETVYVVRADGRLFEIDLKRGGGNSVKEYKTSLTVKHNVEGLCYDKDNDRLLLATKDENPNLPGYKGIYAFDLAKKTFIDEPVYKIDMNDKAIGGTKKNAVSPSAIAIHPTTRDMYITDGPQAKLLILDAQGITKDYIELGKDFSQPEGIIFSPQGDLFISNEGTKQPGNILKVQI